MPCVFVAGDEMVMGRMIDLERLPQENRVQPYALGRRLVVSDDRLECFDSVEAPFAEALQEELAVLVVTACQHPLKQFRFGGEVMDQPGLANPGLFRNGGEGRSAVAPIGELPLRGSEDGLASSISAAVGCFPTRRVRRWHEKTIYQAFFP